MSLDSILEIFIGQVPEAIYFALFIIFTKRIKTHRCKFIIITTFEYLLLLTLFPYNIWSHILFFIIEYLLLKLLYKQRAQITDIFTLGIASLFLIITSGILYFIFWALTNNFILYVLVQRILLFVILFILKSKLYKIQSIYKKFWNRNDSKHKPIKSTTFRALNIVLFNISFFVINLGMIFMLLQKGGV